MEMHIETRTRRRIHTYMHGCVRQHTHTHTHTHTCTQVVFESVFNLVGSLHGGVSLGEVGKFYPNEVEDMVKEIQRALRGAYAITLLYGVEERMFAYAEGPNVEFIPTKITNFKWKNGFVYGISEMAKGVGFPDPCSMHSEYLEYGKANVRRLCMPDKLIASLTITEQSARKSLLLGATSNKMQQVFIRTCLFDVRMCMLDEYAFARM